MHVVGLYRQFKNTPAQLVALLTNQAGAIAGNVTNQHLFPALRRPYEVIDDEVSVFVSLIFHAQPVAVLVDSVARNYTSGKHYSAESPFEKPRLTTRAEALWLVAGLSSVNILFDKVWVTLDDQRVIGLPLVALPWLAAATPEQQSNYQASPISIYWPDLENGIDMEYFTGEWLLDH